MAANRVKEKGSGGLERDGRKKMQLTKYAQILWFEKSNNKAKAGKGRYKAWQQDDVKNDDDDDDDDDDDVDDDSDEEASLTKKRKTRRKTRRRRNTNKQLENLM